MTVYARGFRALERLSRKRKATTSNRIADVLAGGTHVEVVRTAASLDVAVVQRHQPSADLSIGRLSYGPMHREYLTTDFDLTVPTTGRRAHPDPASVRVYLDARADAFNGVRWLHIVRTFIARFGRVSGVARRDFPV
jgi:hypothetical protein